MESAFWGSIGLNVLAVFFLFLSGRNQVKIKKALDQERVCRQELIEFILDEDDHPIDMRDMA